MRSAAPELHNTLVVKGGWLPVGGGGAPSLYEGCCSRTVVRHHHTPGEARCAVVLFVGHCDCNPPLSSPLTIHNLAWQYVVKLYAGSLWRPCCVRVAPAHAWDPRIPVTPSVNTHPYTEGARERERERERSLFCSATGWNPNPNWPPLKRRADRRHTPCCDGAPPSHPRVKPAGNHELCHHTDDVTCLHHTLESNQLPIQE
jgi:hypothetical protein